MSECTIGELPIKKNSAVKCIKLQLHHKTCVEGYRILSLRICRVEKSLLLQFVITYVQSSH